MHSRVIALVVFFICLSAHAGEVASSPQTVRPILLGNHLPNVAVRTMDGRSTTLSEVVAHKPAVLVFYRGGWCPYCNLQLSSLRLIEKDVQALGYQVIAISPDRPEELLKTLGRDHLNYTLVSDSTAAAIEAFGIAYKLDDGVTAEYRANGVDLEQYSGERHHILPVPAVYIVDGDGTLQFSYVHPDYRIRLPADVVLAATQSIAAKKHQLHPAEH